MNKRGRQAVAILLVIPTLMVIVYALINEALGFAHVSPKDALRTREGTLAYTVSGYLNLIVLMFIVVTLVYMAFHLIAFRKGKILSAFFLYYLAAFFYVFTKDEFSLINMHIDPGPQAMLLLRSIAIPLYTASIAFLCYRLFPDNFPRKPILAVEFLQIVPIINELTFNRIPGLNYLAEFILILPLIPCLYVFVVQYGYGTRHAFRFAICLFCAEADLILGTAVDGLSVPLRYACLPAVGSFMVLNVILMADKYRSQTSMETYYKESLDHYLSALQSSENAFLNAQIKPHFLYNTLNTIADLCVTDPAKAKKLIDSLTEYLKLVLELDNMEEQVPLSRELELASAYTAIEKERFPSVNFYNDFPFKLPDIRLPALTIQPLIENALKHGVRKSNRPGAITLRIIDSEDGVQFFISDNGVGMTKETIDKLFAEPKDNKSIGIYNIDKRLKNQYKAGLSVDSTIDLGTCVSFTIPK